MPTMYTKKNLTGFTLVEIMIVVVIIGLLAAMGIPAFQNVSSKSQATRIANDMNKLAHAFEVTLLADSPPEGFYFENSVPSGFSLAELPDVIQKKTVW